ncbi:XRE family transcriptional regulator [Microbulbifer sp. MLAF003]|uniref:helix-turn-helix domain-containing protein n=1 Tax=Microbulbifer sp. MLAF003 TaxID=3032582 RepID=UPI0024ADE206|nr:XRE family transcriptional regulator [Microbulbifer sp. MLAF003]WHI52701.1 XRE family transcriptional regulator [Microbulbifer sp. MLAF003]
MKKGEIFQGDNLRLCRLISGLSLNDLGDRVGTTRQYIQQLEKDSKSPADDLVEALAYELKVKSGFFYKPITNHIKEEECHFRKLKTTLVSARRECTARATLMNRLVDSLDNQLNLPNINFPNLEAVSLYDAEKAALESRKYWNLGDGPIKSMIRVLENAGAIVASFGKVSEKVDALSVHRKRPIVLLNEEKSAPRIRMDLAHECAHIILHNGIETGDKETEDQADYFASTFLLPRAALLTGYGASKRSRIDWNAIKNIKIKWGVSSRSIIYRLNQLEVITPSQYRIANIHLSKTGQTKSEWYDDDVPREHPELLPNSIQLLGETYGHSFGGLLDSLEITDDFLSNLTQQYNLIDSYKNSFLNDGKVTNISAYF